MFLSTNQLIEHQYNTSLNAFKAKQIETYKLTNLPTIPNVRLDALFFSYLILSINLLIKSVV